VQLAELIARGREGFPGHVGVEIDEASGEAVVAHVDVQPEHGAPNGFLHAGVLVTLADTACGYGCLLGLPDDATGFTTVELKTNFVGAARTGRLRCRADRRHAGRTTQVWDATVTGPDDRTLALFRCTQLLLRAR
jgi:1,4-dihydroxy-2-naphthoyl-CoA hydrolase